MINKLNKIGYDLKDITVVQSPISYYNHRGDVNPYTTICNRVNMYPIFVSPMASVTDQHNYKTWINNGFTPIVPRSVGKSDVNPNGLTFEERIELSHETFVSFSLEESYSLFNIWESEGVTTDNGKFYICIDIAHGTLSRLYEICKKFNHKYGKDIIEIMTGNIATPDAYEFYADAGVSWIRLSIGSGSRCTSAANVSIYYPSATLIDELYKKKVTYDLNHVSEGPKLIMDGGIKNFDDIQKALVLGADAVMCGNIFARAEEACGEIIYLHENNLDLSDAIPQEEYFKKLETLKENDDWAHDAYERLKKRKPYRNYYGMSTKRAQRETFGQGNKTAEGIERPIKIEYPIKKWAENMESYLRSCMTYTNSGTLNELKNAEVIILGGGDAAFRK